jgi:hypothetical protein
VFTIDNVMKISRRKLRRIIREETKNIVLEQKLDPKKLDAAATAGILGSKLGAELSILQGGGRPPGVYIGGSEFIKYLVEKSGYSWEEIAAHARKKDQ